MVQGRSQSSRGSNNISDNIKDCTFKIYFYKTFTSKYSIKAKAIYASKRRALTWFDRQPCQPWLKCDWTWLPSGATSKAFVASYWFMRQPGFRLDTWLSSADWATGINEPSGGNSNGCSSPKLNRIRESFRLAAKVVKETRSHERCEIL